MQQKSDAQNSSKSESTSDNVARLGLGRNVAKEIGSIFLVGSMSSVKLFEQITVSSFLEKSMNTF